MSPELNQQQILFAVYAIEMGFASAPQVVSAVELLAGRPGVSLGDQLQRDGVITPEQRRLVEERLERSLVQGAATMDGSLDLPVVDVSATGDGTLAPGISRTGDGREPGYDLTSHGVRFKAPPEPPPPPPEDDHGERIPVDTGQRYNVLGVHGFGGQARILLAVDERIGREVAIKEMLPEQPQGQGQPSSVSSATLRLVRFLREARVTGQLEHPNIVPVHEVGRRPDGTFFYTMRLVHGQTLAAKLNACASLNERLKLLGPFWDICNAIAFAHSRGVVHRDLKPENVMVGEFGETVVLDWGIAKVKGKQDLRAADMQKDLSALDSATSQERTTAGVAIGTPVAMSPEQARGRVDEIDERSDVWGLGVMLYEILTGQKPFLGATARETVRMVVKQPLRPVSQLCPQAPAELAAVTEKALRKEAAGRYQNAKELANEISAYMTGGRVRAYEYSSWDLLRRFATRHKAVFLSTAAVLVVIVAALVFVSFSYRQEARARKREHQERLKAYFHLAEGHAKQAERLAEERMLLAARLHAATSLANNPAHPTSSINDPDFAARHPEAERLRMEALSLVYQTDRCPVTGLLRSFKQKEVIGQVAHSPDGRLLAAGDYAGFISVWSLQDGHEVFRVKGFSNEVEVVAFSPDGKRLAGAGRDRLIKVWELGKSGPVLSLTGANEEVWSLAYSPDGRRIAAGDRSGQIRLWDAASGQSVKVLESHGEQVRGLAYSPDGRFLASGSWDKTARIWDAVKGEKLFVLSGHSDAIYRLAFSPDSRKLATGSYDKTVRLWEVSTGHLLGTLEGHREAVYDVAFSPDGRRLATGSADRTIRLWDAESAKMLFGMEAHRDVVSTLAFSPDGRSLATGSRDGVVKVWGLSESDGLVRLKHNDWAYGVDFSRDGKLVATGGWDHLVRIWDARTGALHKTLVGQSGGVFAVAFSPDGKTVVSAGDDRLVRLWDVESGQQLKVFQGHRDAVRTVVFSPDGTQLASASLDTTTRLWNVQSGREEAVLADNGGRVWWAEFSPDGLLLATGTEDRVARIWGVASRAVQTKLVAHQDWVSGTTFSHNGRMLATSSKDGVAILWDIERATQLRRFVGHQQWVNTLAFSPDDRLLATASDDGFAMVWEVQSGKPLLRIRASGGVTRVLFSPDGQKLAVTDFDSVVLYPLDFSHRDIDPQKLLGAAETSAGLKLEGFEVKVLDQP